jgi:hypothetical protein
VSGNHGTVRKKGFENLYLERTVASPPTLRRDPSGGAA